EAHDKPLVFSFPDLDEDLRIEALEKHDRHGAAFLAAQSGGSNPPPKADTLGWDTVFAIRMTDVNKAIVKQKTTPPTFSVSNPLGEGSSLSGNLAAWQLTTGADGENVNVLVPASSGTFIFGGKNYDLTGVTETAQYHLNVIPPNAPTTKPTETGTKHN